MQKSIIGKNKINNYNNNLMLLSKIIDKLNGVANLNEESLVLKAKNLYTTKSQNLSFEFNYIIKNK